MMQSDSNTTSIAHRRSSTPLRPLSRIVSSSSHLQATFHYSHLDFGNTDNIEPLPAAWDSSMEVCDHDNNTNNNNHNNINNDNDNMDNVYNNGQALEETSSFVSPTPRPRGAKSFSNMRNPVDGLVALGRRLSFWHRHTNHSDNIEKNHTHHTRGKSWDMRIKHSLFKGDNINRRPSLHSPAALHVFYAPAGSIPTPIPGNGMEPPVIPDSLQAGAAARAAAAAQNEINNASRDASLSFDTGLARDSESGIEVSEYSDTDPSTACSDPVTSLPAEIVSHMLSYLDPQSLMNCELVSRSWHEQACSRHVWRQVFHRVYGRRASGGPCTGKKPSTGLGKKSPNQNWKRMFLVRHALEQRWKEGKAAAIYLQGHKDSVYCVQFDE